MRLKKLIEGLGLEVIGKGEVEITGIVSHSKHAYYGNLFIAKKGCLEPHIEEAIANGAKAILTELYNPFLSKEVVQLIAKDLDRVEKELAIRFFQRPSEQLTLFGITGTNGKTTTSYLVRHLCNSMGLVCGLMGTNEYLIHQRSLPSEKTTPDLLTNQKLLREMVKSGCNAAVLEVSSHGLDQNRTELIEFDVAIFSNLTQDHLDYHRDMESYFLSKSKLFTQLPNSSFAILPKEDLWAERLTKMTTGHVMTYGFTKEADLFAEQIELTLQGSRFWLVYQNERHLVQTHLVGHFNVKNTLAATTALLSQGYSLATLAPHLSTFFPISGRFERVPNEANLNIFVDYAHTPDALENVLQTLVPFKKGKIIVVFGCGGQRDVQKRMLMGQVACRLADHTIITSDNPRKEDPMEICLAISKGFDRDCFEIEVDRKSAIEKGILQMQVGDILMIAGKGHETYQIFSHQTIAFDDRKVVREFVQRGKVECYTV